MPEAVENHTTSAAVMPFTFEDVSVRVMSRDGEPWFVLADVCRVLEIGNPRNVTARLDDEEKDVHSMDTLGGPQESTIINESGLYSLILTSRKPAAKRFKKWVTAEVLPSIRKTGSYGAAPAIPDLSDPVLLVQLLTEHASKRIEAEKRAAVAEKRAEAAATTVAAFDRIAKSDGSLCITDAAKDLQIRPKELFSFLRSRGWIYSRPGKAGNIAYQEKIQSGYLEHKITVVPQTDGTEKTTEQVRVTPKGLAKLALIVPGAQSMNGRGPGSILAAE